MICNHCGQESSGKVCQHCGALMQPEVKATPEQSSTSYVVVEKKENVITGIVGALIGAAIGGASIVLLTQLGFIASISGLILAVCTLKGYELLGGKLSTAGILVGVLLMLVTPYIADRISWAIVIQETFAAEGVTFGEAFAAVPYLIEEGGIDFGFYLKDLLLLYLFVILGAFSTVWSKFKKKKK